MKLTSLGLKVFICKREIFSHSPFSVVLEMMWIPTLESTFNTHNVLDDSVDGKTSEHLPGNMEANPSSRKTYCKYSAENLKSGVNFLVPGNCRLGIVSTEFWRKANIWIMRKDSYSRRGFCGKENLGVTRGDRPCKDCWFWMI